MDKIDRKLLALVQRNNRMTTAELGDAAGLSATSCQRRLNRLRESGVIEKDVSILSPEAVGRPLLLLVEVLMERESTEPIDRFKRVVAASDEACQCYYVTGRATFMLLLTMRDMAEYDGFIRRNFFDNPDVKTFETSVVIDRVKMGFELPLR
jgi:Lrp/AsnC family leucine-responsive transcriptional regulator